MAGGWTSQEIERLAGPRSLSRGLAYQQQGRVLVDDQDSEVVAATVRGSMPYRVELRRAPEISWSCTCPVGEDGDFCKHCVAVAFHVASDEPDRPELVHSKEDGPELGTYLAGLHRDELVGLLLEQAESDWRLRQRLIARALASRGGSLDGRDLKTHIDAAFGDRRSFVPYEEAGRWAQDVFEVIDALSELIDAGHAGAVVALVEHAHRRAEAAIQYVDDSDGWLSDISGRLAEIHLRACELAEPDPADLARRLAELELTSELGAFRRAAATYADVLGAEGIAAYRQVVEPIWKAARKTTNPYSHTAFLAREALVGVAQARRDPDDLIAVCGDDLGTPDAYLDIASELAAAGRHSEAIDWSHRGLATFADRHWQTPPLREFLAAQLRTAGDDDGAERLWWDAFERHPSLDSYRKLLAECANGHARGQQAIAFLRARLDAGAIEASPRGPLPRRDPATTLVEVLLYEGEADDAWAAASAYGCDERTWLTLARTREATHPLDAIPVYERAVAAQVGAKNNDGYRAAVDFLARIRTLADKAGQPEYFTKLLSSVTAEHARKRNLMALIAKKRWT